MDFPDQQVNLVILDRRDRKVRRVQLAQVDRLGIEVVLDQLDSLAIMDRKDPMALKEIEAVKVLLEAPDPTASPDLQDLSATLDP